MTNFRINFLYPWLLLLLIPAYALALFLHLRIAKRYRRTRNRVVSVILYLIISTLSILTLAGVHFTYEIPNLETEVILLVDQSYSGKDVETYSVTATDFDSIQIMLIESFFSMRILAAPENL